MSGMRLTPAEANARLPFVRAVAADAAELASSLAAADAAYRAEKGRPLPSQVALNDANREIRRLREGIATCSAELTTAGATFGEAPTGYVDFAAEVDGAPVLLCWKLGEDRVEHFHGSDEDHRRRRVLPILVNGAV